MGYRSVRVLLQRPTGQRITRNSRLDSAEFERAPADLAFLHCFASLCFALGLACLASSLLSSPLLSSPLLSSLLRISSLVIGTHWIYRVFPAVFLFLSVSTRSPHSRVIRQTPARPNRNSPSRGLFEREPSADYDDEASRNLEEVSKAKRKRFSKFSISGQKV